MGRGISTITTKGISCIPVSFAWTFRHVINGGSDDAGRAFIGEVVKAGTARQKREARRCQASPGSPYFVRASINGKET